MKIPAQLVKGVVHYVEQSDDVIFNCHNGVNIGFCKSGQLVHEFLHEVLRVLNSPIDTVRYNTWNCYLYSAY